METDLTRCHLHGVPRGVAPGASDGQGAVAGELGCPGDGAGEEGGFPWPDGGGCALGSGEGRQAGVRVSAANGV